MKELNIKDFIEVCEVDEWYQVKTLFGLYEVTVGNPRPTSDIFHGYFCDLENDKIDTMDLNTRVSVAIRYAAMKQEIYFYKHNNYYPIIADPVEI